MRLSLGQPKLLAKPIALSVRRATRSAALSSQSQHRSQRFSVVSDSLQGPQQLAVLDVAEDNRLIVVEEAGVADPMEVLAVVVVAFEVG